MSYYLGVDIGGTNTAVGIVDKLYNLVSSVSFKTNAPIAAEELCNNILDAAKDLCENLNISIEDIACCGIGCPGLIKNGVVINASNMKFDNVPLADMFKSISGIKTVICNDANAAAFGEYVAGCGKNCSSLVAITIGTGIGGGIVLNGKIYDGFNGAGAEVGHITIIPDGRKCGCGSYGCFEAYCSATALVNDTKAEMKLNPQSALWQVCDGIDSVDGKTVFDAAALDDGTACMIINRFIKHLSTGLSSIIALLQPEIVCIGGGISAQGKNLTDPLNKYIENHKLFSALKKKPLITVATLGNDAGIIGAAANAIEETENVI